MTTSAQVASLLPARHTSMGMDLGAGQACPSDSVGVTSQANHSPCQPIPSEPARKRGQHVSHSWRRMGAFGKGSKSKQFQPSPAKRLSLTPPSLPVAGVATAFTPETP